MDERALFAVELACDEACSNIIRHGYAGRPGEIHVTCLVSHSDFVVEVADHGPPFNPSRSNQSPPPGR
ncbi:MAG: ATP-binding protein [Anaerolineae bacterium]|nr:MAG: ATP-binding protein [Anaerolineae bacterium]